MPFACISIERFPFQQLIFWRFALSIGDATCLEMPAASHSPPFRQVAAESVAPAERINVCLFDNAVSLQQNEFDAVFSLTKEFISIHFFARRVLLCFI